MKGKSTQDLRLAFDVGHSSIGWAVLQTRDSQSLSINLLGCGSVIFRADDCLASSRRTYRRQRRHIRSTRQRIARLKIILRHLGALTENELNQPGCAWPWLLAARILRGGKLLTWTELWDVTRWYAHNRGYDGNRRWSAADADAQKEDSEKEANARTLMGKYATGSMAETFCAISGLDPLGDKKSTHLAGDKRPKGQNAAFPREIVEGEFRRVLRAHFGKLKGVDASLEKVLFSDWRAIPCAGLKLPKRYAGGLLFGQLVPRFDNRIISSCPISGQKVPSRNCPEFLEFRWAMQLANIQVGDSKDRALHPLSAEHRAALNKEMREHGYFTPKELKDAVRRITGCSRDNLDTMLMHPDAKEALLLDPIQKLITSEDFQPYWKLLPERLQKRLRGKWRRGKVFSLSEIRSQLEPLGDISPFDKEIQRQLDAHNSKTSKKEKQSTHESWMQRHLPPRPIGITGRAAFARHLLKQAAEDVLAGKGHPKEEGGCLFVTPEIREAQLNRKIDDQTNNHLVRHRLLILEKLLRDIIKEYADDKKERVGKITIEVNRNLRAMSGKTAKQKAQDLGLQLANHHAVSRELEEAFEGQKFNGKPIRITAGLIRKGRVADDLGRTCPYTGQKYEPIDLVSRRVDKDHIVPRSQRPSDGLDSLVITFSEINKWKDNRTAWQFVSEEQGKPVPGLNNLSIVSITRYKQFVESLEAYKGHDDDKRRKKKRKELMLLPKYEEKEFIPRDLTQTSQLVRLGAQILRKNLPHLTSGDVTSLPGSVTGTVRKAWKVLGCLATANPQVLEENGDLKSKTEIRGVTHLHHALDACVLGLASHFIPNNGHVWELIVKRNPNEAEKRQLQALGVFGFNSENRFEMRDLADSLKDQIRVRLAEKRVVQHIPARMDGLRVEQNIWGIVSRNQDGSVLVRQQIRQPDGSRKKKEVPERKAKLLGLEPTNGIGKLAATNGVLVIPDNYGVAVLDHATDKNDKFVIIPWHKVWVRIFEGFKDKEGTVLEKSLVERNSGKMPRIVRNGQIVRVTSGTYKDRGAWKITSIKNQKTGIKVNLGQPDTVNTEEEVFNEAKKKMMRKVRAGCKHEAGLASLVEGGLQILRPGLTGHPILIPKGEQA